MATISDKPKSARKTEPAVEKVEKPAEKFGHVVGCSLLNCRVEPSLTAGIAGTLKCDTQVAILETKDGWTKYKSIGLVGWSRSEYIKED